MKYFIPLVLTLGITASLWAYPPAKATVRLTPSGAYPIGTLGKVFVAGGGVLLDTSWHDVAIPNFSLGVQTGCWYFAGQEGKAEWAAMVPLFATMRYEVPLSYEWILLPGISVGMTYTVGSFTDRYKEEVTRAAFHLAYGAGLMLEYRVSHDFGVVVGGDCVLLYEPAGLILFAHAQAGVYWRFR